MNFFSSVVKLLRAKKLYPSIKTITGPSSSPNIIIDGKKYLTFCSNNYLGIAADDQIKEVVKEAIESYGIGSGSTRLLSGTLDIQVQFEKELADFYNFSDSITFSSGYLASLGTIRMLVDPFPYFALPFGNKNGVIFSDELNHASIVDSVRMAKAERVIYKHNDLKDLELQLSKHKKNSRKLIITDGVFSMDGDLADLRGIAELSKEYDALIYVDDAHATGILGPHGEGTAHHLGVQNDMDIIMGSFTKAWGSLGGFIVIQDQAISDYLRVTARSYIFSDPILPAIVAGLSKTLQIIVNGDELRRKTLNNAKYLRENLISMGFEVLGENMPIVPPLLFSEKKAIEFSRMLFEAGILAPAVRRPAVQEGKERLRLTTMSTHTKEQLDFLLENMKSIGKKLKII